MQALLACQAMLIPHDFFTHASAACGVQVVPECKDYPAGLGFVSISVITAANVHVTCCIFAMAKVPRQKLAGTAGALASAQRWDLQSSHIYDCWSDQAAKVVCNALVEQRNVIMYWLNRVHLNSGVMILQLQ